MTLTLFRPRSTDEVTKTLADYLPGGELFRAKVTGGTTLRSLLVGLATELSRVDATMNDMIAEQDPRTTQQLLDEWEAALGIPDGCFNGDGTDDERRTQVVIKLSLAVSTAASFIALATELGFDCELTPGSVNGAFTMIFPIILFPTGLIARHTLFVDLPHSLNPNLFPLTFPFIFADRQSNIIECLFNRLKPANVQFIYRYIL